MENRIYAGIDPAIGNTGVVILDEYGQIVNILNSFSKQILSKKTKYYSILRLSEIRDIVIEMLQRESRGGYVKICFENYSHASTNRKFTIGELHGVLRSSLVDKFGHIHLVEPTTLKQFATGNGASGKDTIILQAKSENQLLRELPGNELTSDICDAFFLAKFCWHRYAPENVMLHEPHNPLLRLRLTISDQKKRRQNA